jgi:hypothetical protein
MHTAKVADYFKNSLHILTPIYSSAKVGLNQQKSCRNSIFVLSHFYS